MLALKSSDLRTVFKNQVNFNTTHKQSHSLTTLKTSKIRPAQSISTPGLKTSQLRSQHENEVEIDPLHRIKLISTPPLKSSQFDPHSKIKSISMPRRTNQLNFDPDTKTKYFQPPHKNQVNYRSKH